MTATEQELLMFNDNITAFNRYLYNDVFTTENITSKKKSIPYNEDKLYGYFMEKDKITYFVPDDIYKHLPFRVLQSEEIDYKTDVFSVISKVTPIAIPAENRLSFRELIDRTPYFSHTNKTHFLLYKICAFSALVDRTNFRVSTDAGFGKDSVVNIFSKLVGGTSNIYGATFAKLEYCLKNKLLILNEMGNLKADDKVNMQEFLLAVGGFFNEYNKRSRKSEGTLEMYDISNTSLIIFYNLPTYYLNKTQEYFDQMFTGAVTNRFIPFVFDGKLTTEFSKLINCEDFVTSHAQEYKDIIATINYYKQNKAKEIKFKINEDKIMFSEDLHRYKRSFYVILKYLSEYCSTQEEFDSYSIELYKCYKAYDQYTNLVSFK